jgi:MinD-like ATPase involved in chromosome partitioning or flagellar assembly
MIDLFKRDKAPSPDAVSRSICVWGPPGSPGKSTIALNLACELALEGRRVLLIDLDTYAPSLANLFGLLDHPAGLAAAARLVGQGRLDLEQIERLSVRYEAGSGQLAILTGLSSTSRWPEISREKTEGIISCAIEHFEFVIVDVASHLDGAIRQVGGAVDRNIAARAALEVSSMTIAVIAADPVGTKRFLDSFEQLAGLAPNSLIVANRLRASALGSRAKQELEDTVKHFCNRAISAFIPNDAEALDKAVLQMVPLAMMKRGSPARQAIAQFARLNFLQSKGLREARVAKLN